MRIRDLDPPRDADACDAIVAGLPDWFGNEQGIAECAAAVRSQQGLVADDDEGVRGFLTWEAVSDGVAEITWMAVRADARRSGTGRMLLGGLVDRLRTAGVTDLRVKTLSSRHPSQEYAETRAFYRAKGFEEVEELDIWGPENPAVLLSRRV
jgi:ribosomal protein S18 acetylase RimI-like enzyme